MLTWEFEKYNRSYHIEVHKGLVNIEGVVQFEGQTYRKVVATKSFSLVVRETSINALGNEEIKTEYFMDLCARAGEFKYAITKMERDCKDLKEIRALVSSLRPLFSVAIKKDAAALVRRAFRLFDDAPMYDITARTKKVKPLPPNYYQR
jgi:hypothetical protein